MRGPVCGDAGKVDVRGPSCRCFEWYVSWCRQSCCARMLAACFVFVQIVCWAIVEGCLFVKSGVEWDVLSVHELLNEAKLLKC